VTHDFSSFDNRPKMRSMAGSSRRVTVCKICLRGIFQGQAAVWSTGQYLGLVHDCCGTGQPMDTAAVNLKAAYQQFVPE
jgi:hypothetical protein